MFFRSEPKPDEYDRDATLAAAARAESKGQLEKANAEYQKVLRWEPQNHALHTKVAVLFARTNRGAEAWTHFLAAAEGHAREGFAEKAIAVYTQAVNHLPTKVELWASLADLYLKRERKADAIKACLDGRRQFRGALQHQQAAKLLVKAGEIEPWHYAATLDLARLRAATGVRADARRLLEGLAARNRGAKLRTVRRWLFNLSPTPAAAWRWLRAALVGR